MNRTDQARAIVIGSGFGGLAAAVRLGARGYRVTVLEQLDAAGGRAYVHRQDGFTFDAGPTIITAPFLLEELWSLAGRRLGDDVQLRALDPFYKVRFDDGEVFEYSADLEAMRAQIARIEPRDVPGFDRFLEYSGRIYDVAFVKLAHEPFHEMGSLLRAIPDLVRLSGFRSVYGEVCRHFRSPKLRVLFSFHPLLIGGNPLSTTAYYCLIAHLERSHGVHYAAGGMGSLVRGLVGLIEAQGGLLRYGARVERILVEDRRAVGVRLSSGEELRADVVVSNADAAFTYQTLLADQPRRRWSDARLRRARYSMSLFVWYFGTRRRYEDVYHHTMVFGPRYEGLLRDIFERHRLASDFSLYLHRPSATDPTLAPPGCDSFYVLSPVPHLDSGVDWSTEAERYRQRIEARLEQTLLPGLRRAIVTQRLLTPLDFQDRLLSVRGAAFSLQPQFFQSAWFRPHNRSEEVDRLYLVGAGTHPGAGIPGVLSSARVLDRIVPSPVELGR